MLRGQCSNCHDPCQYSEASSKAKTPLRFHLVRPVNQDHASNQDSILGDEVWDSRRVHQDQSPHWADPLPQQPWVPCHPRRHQGRDPALLHVEIRGTHVWSPAPHNCIIYEAVDQIAQIHPEITDQFEKGAIQAWYNDSAAQGAYALLKPRQVENVQWLMYPWRNIYFAGEAISFANGWIQGAMESGLRAAYQFYARNENAAKL